MSLEKLVTLEIVGKHCVKLRAAGNKPPRPVGSLEVVVEPAKQNLLRGQAQELLQRLVLLQQPVELGVELDVDLAQQTAADNLPDEAEDEMLADLNDVAGANVDDGAANTLGGLDDDVVVLGHVEGIEGLDLAARHVQDTLVDGVGDAVVDELGEDQTILALVEHLKGIGREGEAAVNVGIACEDGIDVARELGPLIFVDGVGDVGAGALDLNLSADAALGDMAAAASGALRNDAGARWRGSGREALLRRGSVAELGDELRRVSRGGPRPDGWQDSLRRRSLQALRAATSPARLP